MHCKPHLKNFALLFLTRFLRMFSYGMLAVIFFENLFLKGISELEASWIQTAIVAGDIGISLYLTTRADRLGRINTLMAGALLKLITGIVYAGSENIIALTIAGILGVISVTGGEIGPFMPVEQSALSQLVEKSTERREETEKNIAKMFGYYNLIGYLAQASGSAFAGVFINYSQNNCSSEF
jgi:MFS family permease